MEAQTLTLARIDEDTLLRNHLHFLSRFRGNVHSYADAWCIDSDKAEYTFAIPGKNSTVTSLVSKYGRFQLRPQLLSMERPLVEMGFRHEGAFNYMYMPASEELHFHQRPIEVVRAETKQDIADFSEVQALGFCESVAEYWEWKPWLLEANLKNYRDDTYAFYVARMGGEAVAVSLVSFLKSTAGVYAVTTLPRYRKQGAATAILREIQKEAQERNVEMLTLQSVHGSYAEFFYQRLGFKSGFLMKVMSRS